MRTLLSILLLTLAACNHPNTSKNLSVTENKITENYKANLISINGKYQIDTAAILNNDNLSFFIDKLEKTELDEKKTVTEIPSFVITFLDSLNGEFSIANPGEDWQSTDCIVMGKPIHKTVYDKKSGDSITQICFDESQPLPSRQLIYFGLGKDIALMTYFSGGIGVSEHIVIITFDNNKIVDFWCGLLFDVKNQAMLIKYLKENKNKEWGLNTNIIYL